MQSRDILPQGVSSASFARALSDLAQVVGADYVVTDPERLLPYTKSMLPIDEREYLPSGVVMPSSVEHIQGVLGICNRYRLPLWPISTGRNFGYGSALPATRGQLILDLKRMDRILEIDPVLCTALVEPGVTYQQLHDRLAERSLALWLDFPGTGPLAGPLGNTLERGGGHTPYGDHFAHACGMEVVLADGRVLRTGTGCVPNTDSWQASRYGYGPYLDGIFTQSNFAVVTKLGLWLMPAPAAHRTVMAQYWDERDLGKAVETVRPLRLNGTLQNVGVLASAALMLSSHRRRAELYQGEGTVPDRLIESAAREQGIAPWNLIFTLYGTAEQIAPNLEIARRAFEGSGAKLVFDVHEGTQSNELGLESFSLLNWVGGGGLAWFSPIAPARGTDAVKQRELAKSLLARHGMDYLGAFTLNGRDLHHLVPLLFDRTVQPQLERARQCFADLVTEFTDKGYALQRVGVDNMGKLARLYAATNRDVNRMLKRALDPNGILAPGKSGIHS